MAHLLSPGDTVATTDANAPCTVIEFLGYGGQGEVYRASWKGEKVALKWYYPHAALPEGRAELELLAKDCPSESWLWPLEVVTGSAAGYGYIMRLREDRFVPFSDLVLAKVNPTLRTLATAAIGICQRLAELHNAGFCCLLDWGGFMFDPATGEVIGCSENIHRANQPCALWGVPDLIAPELLRREPGAHPSVYTDLHSLAVLLFHIFFKSHPLAGRKQLAFKAWDALARERLYGHGPVFIFDPNDTSNEAVDESVDPYKTAGHLALKNWPIFPSFLKDRFTQAFTKGLTDPSHGRVRESQWIETLSKLRDSWFKCACGAENFHDVSEVRPCWHCGKQPQLPPRILIGTSTILLTPNAKIYQHHLTPGAGVDANVVAAEVAPHPTQKNLHGLLNTGTSKWIAHATGADGVSRQMDVEPGKKMLIAKGVRINFGTAVGEIDSDITSMPPHKNGGGGTEQYEMTRLPLDFIFVIDCSASMDGVVIESLNFWFEELFPGLRRVADMNPHCEVFIRALTVADNAAWHPAARIPLEFFRWSPVRAATADCRNLGKAFQELSKVLALVPPRSLPPVIVLTLAGTPTDDWKLRLEELLENPWARKAQKIGIAIGQDADIHVLKEFMGFAEARPLMVKNASDLLHKIRWVPED